MATVTDLMREIHRLRRHAKDLQAELDRGPRQLTLQKKKITLAEEAKLQAQEAIKKLKVANHEREVSLKATNAQVAKHERQLNESASKKEYDALKAEIAAERTKSLQLEDEILAGLLEVDERTARLPELDQNISRARADFTEFERTYASRQSDRTAMLQDTLAKLAEVEREIPEDLRLQYQRQIAAFGEDSMAVVEGNTCRACYTSITAQNMNELRVGKFVACKSCGRFLYFAE